MKNLVLFALDGKLTESISLLDAEMSTLWCPPCPPISC